MRWYQLKEQAAGTKRLFLMWYIYNIFGKNAVKFLAFFVTIFAFIGAKEPRRCSKKYLEIAGLKPSLLNQFRHFLEYSYSLVDRMEIFSGKFDFDNIVFNEPDVIEEIINSKDGVFFICSHLGNIDVLRAFLYKYPEQRVNVFLTEEHCKIFNGFIKMIEKETPVTTYPVEDIGIDTSIEIKEKLSGGEYVFIAGDRTSKNSVNSEVELFSHKVKFPVGTFKLAQIMESPVYFVCALRQDFGYRVYLKKFVTNLKRKDALKQMQCEYAKFIEKYTHKAPLQFFHFYDLFDE